MINSFTHADTGKFDLDVLLNKSESYASAAVQLDQQLQSSGFKGDDEVWAMLLLKSARLKALQSEHKSAVSYLQSQPWPENPISQIILKLGTSSEIEHYLNHKSWNLVPYSGRNGVLEEANTSEFHQLLSDLERNYYTAFDASKKHEIALDETQGYLTTSDYPPNARGHLADVVASRWMEFLTDDMYWSEGQRKHLQSISLSTLLDLRDTQPLLSKQHPLFQIKRISARLYEWHKSAGRKEAAFEALRYYTGLLSNYFSSTVDIKQLSRYLDEQLKQLGSQYAWWSMGKYQLASYRQRMPHNDALLEAHGLAVQASIAHPRSVGGLLSEQLLSELEYQEFSLSGHRNSGPAQASIRLSFRNLYRLYFRAWKVDKPLPKDLGETEKQVIIKELLNNKADVEWVVDLSDHSDLRRQEVQLIPQVSGKGHWLLLASPSEEFANVPSKLQLLDINISDYVASVNYYNGEFRVAVYDRKQGRGLPNITAELLEVGAVTSEVLASEKTDVHGVAVLKRLKDASHYQVRLQRGEDNGSILDIPGLLPLENEMRWLAPPAKSVLITNNSTYHAGDAIYWIVLTKGAERGSNSGPTPLSNKQGWVRLYNPENQLVAEKGIKLNQLGLAHGEFQLKGQLQQSDVGRWRIESSWHGHHHIQVVNENKQQLNLDAIPEILLPNQQVIISGRVTGTGSNVKTDSVQWELNRISYQANGDLFAFKSVSQGIEKLSANQRFNFKIELPVVDTEENLRHRFELHLSHLRSGNSLAKLQRSLVLLTQDEFYNIYSDKAFFESKKDIKLKLARTNSRWQGVTGKAQWFLYRLIPSQQVHVEDTGNVKPLSLGGLHENGSLTLNEEGQADLHLRGLAAGAYRLRFMGVDKTEKVHRKRIAELDFIVAQAERENHFNLGTMLLAERPIIEAGDTLKLLVGSDIGDQWVRFNILKGGKVMASQMLSPGVHLLEYPVSKAHQGGVGFNLEWVEQNQLNSKDILVKVPWTEKQLELDVHTSLSVSGEAHRLQVASSVGKYFNLKGAKVFVYYSEATQAEEFSEAWESLGALYQQSQPSMIRLDTNGTNYSQYFRGVRHIVSAAVSELRHPEIRYSRQNNERYLGKRMSFDLLPMMMTNSDGRLSSVALAATSKMPKSVVKQTHSAPPAEKQTSYFQQGVLDDKGSLMLKIPSALKDKAVNARILVVAPDMKTGTLSTVLR